MAWFNSKEPEPLKSSATVASAGEGGDFCQACCTTFDDALFPRSDDEGICVPCSNLTHFERELLWVLNNIASSLDKI